MRTRIASRIWTTAEQAERILLQVRAALAENQYFSDVAAGTVAAQAVPHFLTNRQHARKRRAIVLPAKEPALRLACIRLAFSPGRALRSTAAVML